MASTYTRSDSPWVWIRLKDKQGKWLSQKTRFRKDNFGDKRQAELVARRLSQEEATTSLELKIGGGWDWVPGWIEDRYIKQTATVYRRYWRHLRAALKVSSPSQVAYQTALEYREERGKSVGINTVIHELKFFGQVMNEAVKRGLATGNPLVRLGMRRDPAKEKLAWSDEQIRKVMEWVHVAPQWLQVTFWCGLYQAARLRQCDRVLLSDIDFDDGTITWRKTKGDKPFTQPIDPRLAPKLRELAEARRAAGHATLCELPTLPSCEWREFLDVLGLEGLCHHGLRVSWITRAARSKQVSLAEAKRFVNHGSTSVHEIYQKLNADDIAHVPRSIGLPSPPS